MSDADVLVTNRALGVAPVNRKKLVEYRARITVMAIEKAIASTERP